MPTRSPAFVPQGGGYAQAGDKGMDRITNESCIFFIHSTLFLIPAKDRIKIVFEILISWFPFSPVCYRQGGDGGTNTKDGGIENSIFCLKEYPVLV